MASIEKVRCWQHFFFIRDLSFTELNSNPPSRLVLKVINFVSFLSVLKAQGSTPLLTREHKSHRTCKTDQVWILFFFCITCLSSATTVITLNILVNGFQKININEKA